MISSISVSSMSSVFSVQTATNVFGAESAGITAGVWVSLALALLLIIVNGAFVALEFALIATQKSQLEPYLAEGNKRAESTLASIKDLNTQVAGAQLGITVASIALGYLAEPSIAAIAEELLPFLGPALRHTVAIIIAYFIATFLHMVIGEMVPKNLALASPAGVSMALAPPARIFAKIMSPVIGFLNFLAGITVRLLGVEVLDERGEARTPAELASLLEESRGEGVLDDFEHSLLSGTLDLREATVASEMVAWSDVVSVPAGATVEEIEGVVVGSGHSRLPALAADGSVAGWVHAKDLLSVPTDDWQTAYAPERLRPPMWVNDQMNLEQVLLRMQRGRRHFALVRSADQAVAGIITLEDVLESVVGEIVDETDPA